MVISNISNYITVIVNELLILQIISKKVKKHFVKFKTTGFPWKKNWNTPIN